MAVAEGLDAVLSERVATASGHSSRAGGRFELRCASCGYGVVVRMAPDRCPMCQGSVWEHADRAGGWRTVFGSSRIRAGVKEIPA